jgi:hypothetical protein
VRLQFSGARDSSAATCATSTSRSFPYRAFLHNLTVFDQLRTLEPAEHHREFKHPRTGIASRSGLPVQARAAARRGRVRLGRARRERPGGGDDARAGLRVEALFGDIRRGPFQAGREQIWVARHALSAAPAGASD